MTNLEESGLDLSARLTALGWDDGWEAAAASAGAGLIPMRVGAAVRGKVLLMGQPPLDGLWVSCRSGLLDKGDPLSIPAVGDWVMVRPEGEGGVIEALLARRTCFTRRAAGRRARPQVVAANIDRVFIVSDVVGDFNVRRLERYLATVWDSGAEPIIVLNKTDLEHDPAALWRELEVAAAGVTVLMVSALNSSGLGELVAQCGVGLTVALVGSSGVGKSTMVNALVGGASQAVAEVRPGDGRGRHTTTRQELVPTPAGALLIDTPGMRELGLWQAEQGVDRVFDDLVRLAQGCRFRDCAHAGEPGCAVLAAVRAGELEADRLESYQRLQRELEYTARQADPREASNSKKHSKDIRLAARQMYQLNDELGLKGK